MLVTNDRILLMIPKPFGIHDNLEIYSECQLLLSLLRSNLSASKELLEQSIFLQEISELQRKLMIFSSQELPLVVVNLPRRNDRSDLVTLVHRISLIYMLT